MMIMPMILAVGAIYLIYKREESRKLEPCRVKDNSLNILNERFARGEISEDEYMIIRSTLNNR